MYLQLPSMVFLVTELMYLSRDDGGNNYTAYAATLTGGSFEILEGDAAVSATSNSLDGLTAVSGAFVEALLDTGTDGRYAERLADLRCGGQCAYG